MQINADARWKRVRVASDLHLHKDDPQTAAHWHSLLRDDDADAWFLLGDYFEVWVGDDLLDAPGRLPASSAPVESNEDEASIAFWQHCAEQLQRLSARKPVYWLSGNRDFLVGDTFARRTGVTLLSDPVVLQWGPSRRLLSHGDQWCTSDQEYMAFRARVRHPEWQQTFLAQPLSARLTQAKAMREQSQARQQARSDWTDVTASAVAEAAERMQATEVIHGHTHEGKSHGLGAIQRHVLSDWHLNASPPRWSIIELTQDRTVWLNATSSGG